MRHVRARWRSADGLAPHYQGPYVIATTDSEAMPRSRRFSHRSVMLCCEISSTSASRSGPRPQMMGCDNSAPRRERLANTGCRSSHLRRRLRRGRGSTGSHVSQNRMRIAPKDVAAAKLLPAMGEALRKRRHGTGRRSGAELVRRQNLSQGPRPLVLLVSGNRS